MPHRVNDKNGITTTTVSKPARIWLTWANVLGLPLAKSRDVIHFTLVTHKQEARGSTEQEVNDLLRDHGSDLARSQPGYVWSKEPLDAWPEKKYVIRGDLKW
jgi:hypothetical protein